MSTFIVTQIRGGFSEEEPYAIVTLSRVRCGGEVSIRFDLDEAADLAVGTEYHLRFDEAG